MNVELANINQSLIEKEVTVRGFLYDHPAGCQVLSDLPNIKSCCMHKHVCIEIDPRQPANLRAVSLKGTLQMGSESLQYKLVNAENITPQLELSYLLLLPIIVVGLIFLKKFKT